MGLFRIFNYSEQKIITCLRNEVISEMFFITCFRKKVISKLFSITCLRKKVISELFFITCLRKKVIYELLDKMFHRFSLSRILDLCDAACFLHSIFLQDIKLSIFVSIKNSKSVCRFGILSGRKVRTTKSAVLLNGKISVKVFKCNRKQPPSGKGEKVR